jgi:pimeloyl-ACP methyl ester carboxylesterase
VSWFVLVHGAWLGGWCWDPVATSLRAAGHHVTCPALTGLGDRAHQLTPEVGLGTHVADVATAIIGAPMTGAILVGHSYAGMILPGAVARAAPHVARVVVLDGFLPEAGETNAALLPDAAAVHFGATAARGGWRLPPRDMRAFGVTDEQALATAAARLTDHPLRAYLDPAPAGGSELSVPGTYLLCTGWPTPFRRFAGRAAAIGWEVRDLNADHLAMLTAPALLTAELLRLAPDGRASL